MNDDVVRTFQTARVYRNNEKRINSLSFTTDGHKLLSSSDDGTLQIYDCINGERAKVLNSLKYGVDLVRSVHSGMDTCLVASKSETDHDLRYWDLHEHKFIRYFKGHKGPALSLEVHPYEDLFLSSGADGLAMLWDLRRPDPIARINGKGPCYSAFDQQGLIFAVSAGRQKVHLLDSKNYEAGEFASFDIAPYLNNPNVKIRGLKFTPDGKFLMVQTDNQRMLCMDAFDAQLVREYYLPEASAAPATITDIRGCPSMSISPDSQYLACGSDSGVVNVWNVATGTHVKALEGHPNFPRQVAFSPTSALLATACENLALWLPSKAEPVPN